MSQHLLHFPSLGSSLQHDAATMEVYAVCDHNKIIFSDICKKSLREKWKNGVSKTKSETLY